MKIKTKTKRIRSLGRGLWMDSLVCDCATALAVVLKCLRDTHKMELLNQPRDATSRVHFSPTSDELLLVSSWDCCLRLYDTSVNSLKSVTTSSSPILDCCFLEDSASSLIGSLNGEVSTVHFEKGGAGPVVIGKHLSGVKCVTYSNSHHLAISGSWDSTVALWDLRQKSSLERIQVGQKIFAMCVFENQLLVGASDKTVRSYDLRNYEFKMLNELRLSDYQLRCLETTNKGFAMGTVEGRVFWHDLTDPSLSYSFKCHRVTPEVVVPSPSLDPSPSLETAETADPIVDVFPVNCIGVHKKYGKTFATGGGDGTVSVWDGEKRKKLWKLAKPFPTSVVSLSFGGNKMAVAVSYDYAAANPSEDLQVLKYSQIIVREVNEQDIKSK